MQFRIADELRALEPVLRELIAARIARGKVDCRVSLTEGERRAAPRLNEEALRRLRALAEAARKRLSRCRAAAHRASCCAGRACSPTDARRGSAARAAAALCRRALDELVAARSREGAKLAAGILERVRTMRERVETVAPLVPRSDRRLPGRRSPSVCAKRSARPTTSASAPRSHCSPPRCDVAEELDRLRAHLDEVERVLRAGGAVGKRLDFLAQELNREANTLASKALERSRSADCALELKLLIEQVREQVQNLNRGKRAGRLFVITAPSGAGKTSLIDALMRADPSLKLSISYTTRAPRPGEKDGVDYHFVDDAAFLAMQQPRRVPRERRGARLSLRHLEEGRSPKRSRAART